ncbi:TRAP transporter small permease [Pacificispira sp.]|uniref:TRAP transporter small permease n=1 Tax=Pacificispira sp. TaxID=2888761 RepID=UPI003B51D0B7
MRSIEKFLSGCSGTSAFVAGLTMAVMMLQVTADVLLKYLLNFPIPATLETVSGYYMVALVFLPLGIVTKDRDHICVELFTQHLGQRRLSWLTGFVNLIAIGYSAIIVFEGTKEAIRSSLIMEAWETAIWDIQVWPARWFVPAGFGMMLAFLVLQTVDHFHFARTGRHILSPVIRRSLLDTEI